MNGGRRSPCWASLPPELISHIADCFLETNDIDYYMDFRAVCGDWRHATDDPTNTWDKRFRPSQWIIFLADYDSTIRVFMNTATGGFLRKDMPLLVKYFQVRATGSGYLVLIDVFHPDGLRVLNPFTGHLVLFAASRAFAKRTYRATAVLGSPPTLMLLDSGGALHKAILGSKYVTERMDSKHWICQALLVHAIIGGVYHLMGCPSYDNLFRIFSSYHITMFAHGLAFLVESVGETLMVINHQHGSIKVFKVDAGRNAVEPIKSIGHNRAIFIGNYRCISVSPDKFPSINGNCIYYANTVDTYPHYQIYKYDMTKEKEEVVFGELETTRDDRPITITQVLSSYTHRDVLKFADV